MDVILPVIAFSLYPMALMTRYTRASTLEVINSDYVRMGRARGLSERRVVFRYILRTSLIPLITIMGPQIPNILTGSIFIEATFAMPGLGSYFTTASLHRDYPLIMALVLIVAVLWGVCYIASDIAYVFVDPRVRLEGLSRRPQCLCQHNCRRRRSPLAAAAPASGGRLGTATAATSSPSSPARLS